MEINDDLDIDFDALEAEAQAEIDAQPDEAQETKYDASVFKYRTVDNVVLDCTQLLVTGPLRLQHENDYDITLMAIL